MTAMQGAENHPENYLEVNFDGLVGPSHHYAGLSKGNIASTKNAMGIANPRAAALQGLAKMKSLADLGFIQAVLPPHLRPNTNILHSLGFTGSDSQVIAKAWQSAPQIVEKCFSASAMWTANAATVSPAPDTDDGRTHFTAANLCRMFHRSYESDFTARVLKAIFSESQHFKHHAPLPSGHFFGDEGAANHTRLGATHSAPGLEMFVYGEQAFNPLAPRPSRYPARQSLEASQAIARLHGLASERTVFAQQNPEIIDSGVFHNDVIAVGTTSLLFYHQQAFLNSSDVLSEIKDKFPGDNFYAHEVLQKDISVQTAIQTYLFNTQLLDVGKDAAEPDFLLIAPTECEQNEVVADYLKSIVDSATPINSVRYFDLRESMKNGGGPACLRLRVPLSRAQISSIKPTVLLDQELNDNLSNWINQHYRDKLAFSDLQDPELIDELKTAMYALEPILGLEGIYTSDR